MHDQRRGTRRISRTEKSAHRSALGRAKEGGLIRSNSAHHRSDIIHTHLKSGHVGNSVGQAGAAFVEKDKARERCKPCKEARECGLFPIDLNVRYPSRHEHNVSRAFAQNLICDVDAAAMGIPGVWLHGYLAAHRPWRTRYTADGASVLERPCPSCHGGVPWTEILYPGTTRIDGTPHDAVFEGAIAGWMTALGTLPTWRSCLMLSVDRGEAVIICSFRVFRILTQLGHCSRLHGRIACSGRGHSLSSDYRIRVRDVSVLEARIVAGRSSTLVSNQARCTQVAA